MKIGVVIFSNEEERYSILEYDKGKTVFAHWVNLKARVGTLSVGERVRFRRVDHRATCIRVLTPDDERDRIESVENDRTRSEQQQSDSIAVEEARTNRNEFREFIRATLTDPNPQACVQELLRKRREARRNGN
jgi:hypothetical protein